MFVRRSKITFVDLAGSERLKQSGSEAGNKKETMSINKSLFTLGTVIKALAQLNKARTGSPGQFGVSNAYNSGSLRNN